MKTAKSKLTVLLVVLALLTFSLGLIFMPKAQQVSAEEAEIVVEEKFYIEDGASARLVSGQSGIKWTAHINKVAFDSITAENGTIEEIGIAIKPHGVDIEWTRYSYAGRIEFAEDGSDLVFSMAIYYDDIIADVEDALKDREDLDETAKSELIDAALEEAYAMVLEAVPYAKAQPAEGDPVYVEGEAYDTARSVQGVALYYLVNGKYSDYEANPNNETYETILKGYVNGTYNYVKAYENDAELTSYYSVNDNAGKVFIDEEVPVDNNTKVYLDAKDVTANLNVASRTVELANVEGVPGEEYKLTILDDSGAVYTQKFIYATLAIDEASDFNYFKLKKEADWGKTAANTFTFTDPNDFKWDGYYVVVNDIDASSYGPHDVANGLLLSSSGSVTNFSRQYATQMDAYANGVNLGDMRFVHGLLGTFDGLGHTISNLDTSNNGIFGIVAGGTIKNVAFVNSGNLTQALIAERIIGKSVLDNVFIQTLEGTSHYAYSPVAADISSFASFNNVMIIDRTTVSTSPYAWSRSIGALNSSYWRGTVGGKTPNATFGPEWSNTPEKTYIFDSLYIVANMGLAGSIAGSSTEAIYNIMMDAQYVDAVEQTGDIPYVQGAKRYTSLDKMSGDKNANDFSAWSSDMWTIVDGVPYFTTALDSSLFDVKVNGSDVLAVEIGDTATLSVTYNGNVVDSDITASIVSGTSASLEGTTLEGLSLGSVEVAVNVNGIVKTVTVNVIYPITEYQGDPITFSALDGDFDFAAIVGETTIQKVIDENGNELTFDVANNKINGLATRGDAVTETYILVYTTTKTLRVPLNAYTLVIDEASDLAYFHVTNFKAWGNGNYCFADGEAEFNGYYILANDIDAAGYVHDFNRGDAAYAPTSAGMNFYKNASNQSYIDDMGLTGTFDGNGYAIKNLKITEVGGLFGFINGGTVKNVAFIDFTTAASNTGLLTAYMSAGSTMQDTYWYTTATGNGGWNTQHIMLGAIDGAVIERNVFNWDRPTSAGNYYTGASSGVITENPTNAGIKDFYFINHDATNYTGATTYTATKTDGSTVDINVRRVSADARYVDGVERAATDVLFFETWAWGNRHSLANYTSIGSFSGTYEITLLDGIKRYTSVDTMKADKANNDFSAWSSDIWAVVDGYPQFISQLTGEVTANIGNETIGDTAVEIGKNASYKVTANVGGVKAYNPVSSVEIISGAEFISVEGDVVTAKELGNAVIAITYGDTKITANITVIKGTTEYGTELQFSAHDGLFFNGDQVVSVADILGGEAVLSVAAEDGTPLTYNAETGTIKGFKYTTEDWVDNAIILEIASGFVKVNVKIAELIIDDVSDFAYFTIKEAWDYSVTVTYSYRFTDGDFDWEGYFVLAKNIDATGYTHDLDQGTGNRTTLDAITANRMDYLGDDGIQYHATGVPNPHGFQGTFDGQGYTISNFDSDANGLLGVINGGVIKNLGMINCGSSGYAPLAVAICGSSRVENVFVSTNVSFARAHHAPLISQWSSTTQNTINVVIYDNTTIGEGSYAWGFGYGSFTTSADRDATSQAPTFGPSSSWSPGLSNVIIVSPYAMAVSCAANQQYLEGTVKMDAKYIDGVLNENVYSVKTYSEVGPVAGVRRYTSQDTLTADVANIQTQLNALVATGYFTVADGVISWKNA